MPPLSLGLARRGLRARGFGDRTPGVPAAVSRTFTHASARLPTAPPPELSVVVPVYNEEDSLSVFVSELAGVLRSMGRPYELVAVDDGSSDGSLARLKALKAVHPELHIVAFTAHAGQSAAFAAGFRVARGRVVVTCDADLQNDPADIPPIVAALEGGTASAVAGYRVGRCDPLWRRVQSHVANAVRNSLTSESIRDTGCSLKAFRADALASLVWYDGMHRFLPTLIKLNGGTVVEFPVRHRPRRFGATKYGMWNRVGHALIDALGVRWLQRRRLRYEIREDLP